MSYDVAVIGLGAMGSATVHELARRGLRVLGLEAYGAGHQVGSSGGLSRIIRLAYFEHPSYVPLLRAAWTGWHELEVMAGADLLLETGGLYGGRRGSDVLDGAVRSASEHDLPHELLDAAEVTRRFPAFRLDDDMEAIHEPLAGLLYPERCIQAQLDLARAAGADLRFEERVERWSGASGSGALHIVTDRGEYDADRLVLAAGAWLPILVADLDLPLEIERNVLFWFEPGAARADVLGPDRMPVYIVEVDDEHAFYGFPALAGQGLKIARHHGGRPTTPATVERQATATDEAPVRTFADRYLPGAAGRRTDARVCMYTNTPDRNFIIDFHPADRRVVIASPCSGHGFKFSNVIGMIAADLATEGGTDFDIGFLSLDRFAAAHL
jgi:sarcosine oxidase